MKLTRTDWKYVVDTLMFLCLVGIVLIGLLMGFVIPEGRLGPGQSKFFLGVHRHQWGHIHLWLSLAFTALVVVHLVLAWSWFKGKAKGLFGKAWRPALGLTLGAAVLIPVIFWLSASKNNPSYAEFGEGRGQQARGVASNDGPSRAPLSRPGDEGRAGAPVSTPDPGGEAGVGPDIHGDKAVSGRNEAASAETVITGRMTLRDVEQKTGISAKDLAAKLGLPDDVSLDETLGRLRQVYGFEMQAVRDAVAELLKAKRPPRPF
jgi:Domain of unknown function (DUF4405)